MTTLKDSQIGKLQQRLTDEKRQLEKHFERNDTSGAARSADSGGELSAYDNHPADMATETFERERDLAIDESFREKLQEVNAALHRMEAGTYGICEVCESQMPYERLEALPWTSFCVEHAHTEVNGLGQTESQEPVTYEMLPPVLPDDADMHRTLEKYGSSDSPVPGPREG